MFNMHHNCNISDYDIQTWHDGRLMHGIYADDLDLSTGLEWIGRGKLNLQCGIQDAYGGRLMHGMLMFVSMT